jgi:hypothetical protein
MSSRKLRSRGCSVGQVVGQDNLDENSLTDLSGGRNHDWGNSRLKFITSNPSLENTRDDNAIINLNSHYQSNNISHRKHNGYYTHH